MKFLLAFIFLFSQTTFGQTVGRNIEFNSVSGADYYTNFVINESAKKNAANTVVSNATVARGTTNKIDNVASYSVDASAQNGYVEFTLGTVYDPATSGNCEFKGVFKGDGTLYKAQIVDGSGNLLNQTSVLTNKTNWRAFSVTYPCAASGSRKVRITQTEAGTAPAFSVGKLYYGQITNLQAGVPNNVFSAQVSATGVVSGENEDWISGSVAVTDTSLYTITFVTSKFTVAPNCVMTSQSNSVLGTYTIRKDNPETTTTVTVRTGYSTTGSSFTKEAHPFTIICTRSSTDFIQPAITADQWDFDWKDYTPAITVDSGTIGTYTLNQSQYRRANGKLYLRGKISFTGTNTWNTIRVGYPSGVTVTSATDAPFYSLSFNDITDTVYKGQMLVATTSFSMYTTVTTTANKFSSVSQASPFTWASGDTITWEVGPMDVVGWTNSQNAPQLVGSVIADTSIKADKSAGVTSVDYGTYSATVTNSSNAAPITSPISCTYIRIGSTVSVSCPTAEGCSSAGGTLTAINVTLPIATTQGSTISGVIGTLISGEVGRVQNNGSNLGQLIWNCNQTGSTTRAMNFQYQVP